MLKAIETENTLPASTDSSSPEGAEAEAQAEKYRPPGQEHCCMWVIPPGWGKKCDK